MDEGLDYQDYPAAQSPPHKSWSILKILVSLVFVLVVFTCGVVIGRGDRIHVKYLSRSVSQSSATSLDYSSVEKVYSYLKSDYDGNIDQTKLVDGLKSGMVSALGDPYTVYFNSTDAKDFNQQLAGSFTGIGAELGSDTDNNIVIVSPLSGYPAEKAGLKPKDIIAAVDGKSTAGWSVDAVVKAIRGPAGTNVKLTIVRGNTNPIEITIMRSTITLPSVETKIDGTIGYLKINQFTSETTDAAKKAAEDFKAKGVKAVALDLRGNPGGYLNSAVDVASLWLDKGKAVVSERRGGQVISTNASSGTGTLKGLPTVVLINGGSASASEILAGALHDNNVATIIGEKSFGKGSVQQVDCLDNSDVNGVCQGAELKVTIARWYTPAGKNIDKEGITPDTVVARTDDDIKASRDPQKDKAYEILKTKI